MPPAEIRKIFVLDTNVVLHDNNSVRNFHEHDIVIPITVLEELDNFKKGNESINFHAREFVRIIDELSDDKVFDEGVSLGEGLGKISIKLEKDFNNGLIENFNPKKPDHQILNIAYIIYNQWILSIHSYLALNI